MRQFLVRGMAGLAILVLLSAVLPTATFAAPQAAPEAQDTWWPGQEIEEPIGAAGIAPEEVGRCDYAGAQKAACEEANAQDRQRPQDPSLRPNDTLPLPSYAAGREQVSADWNCSVKNTQFGVVVYEVTYRELVRQVGISGCSGYTGDMGTVPENSLRLSLSKLGLGRKDPKSTITLSIQMDPDGACYAESCRVLPGSP